MGTLSLADRNQLRFAAGQLKHAVADELVVEDNIRGLERPNRLHGEKLGIARTCPHKEDTALRRLGFVVSGQNGVFDFHVDQLPGRAFVAVKHGAGGRTIENTLPQPAAPRSFRKGGGHAIAKLAGKLGQVAKSGMQLILQPRAQALGQDGRGGGCADRHRDFAAIHDRRQCGSAKGWPVRDVDGHTQSPRDLGDAGVLVLVLRGRDDQGPTTNLIDAGP